MIARLLPESSKRGRKTRSKFGRGDARYWSEEPGDPGPDGPKTGRLIKDPRSSYYVCRFRLQGRRESIPLHTGNKSVAAAKAAEAFRLVSLLGWDEALPKLKPVHEEPATVATLGEFLEAVRTTIHFNSPITLNNYVQALRLIVASIKHLGDQADKNGIVRVRTDVVNGGAELWQAAVEAQSLSCLTKDAILAWRKAYLEAAGDDPAAERSRKASARSRLANARALFATKILDQLGGKLVLPDPIPFSGVPLGPKPSAKYTSRITPSELIAKAEKELGRESFKIFVLGLVCGLRKGEIDTLLWRQVIFDKGIIMIEPTEFFRPKSGDSIGPVGLDEDTVATLREWRKSTLGPFVVESRQPPRLAQTCAVYRCESHAKKLYKWLRDQGVPGHKPLHTLRKECGSVIATEFGIYAASRHLRHAQISTTSEHYADMKDRVTSGLGAFLGKTKPESPADTP